MPYLGAGVANNAPVTPIPTAVFTPTPGVAATCRFYNPGGNVVYIGGANVSPVNGLPILPGNRPLELQNANTTLYACCGVGYANPGNGTLLARTDAGSTLFTVTTAAPTAGTYVRVGSGTGVEYLYISTVVAVGGTPYTVTTSTASLYDHAVATTVATLTNIYGGSVTASAGVV